MQLIVISSENHLENELDWLHQLFEAGLTHFHLRKPGWSEDEIRMYLSKIDPKYIQRIVLHDNYSVRDEFNIKGLHGNKRNEWAEVMHSVSCHTIDEIFEYYPLCNYVFLSPIFDSISKEGYTSKFEEGELRDFFDIYHEPTVIALGGVDHTKVEWCAELGFNGVAVLGAIWNSDNPLEAFKTIQDKCQKSASRY